ncbi:MAG: TauD/TfdA dioxygenase family protein [Rhizomicrobium sp.]
MQPFGVELDHDLSAPLSGNQADRFVGLLWENGLVLARGQRLSMERQRELCALAGPILLRAGESGYLSTESGAGPSVSELSWHSDAAYTDAPFDAIALHAVDVVDDASSTCFMRAEDALDSLPPELRHRLEGKQVEMIAPTYDSIGLRSCDRRDPVAQKRGVLPAIYRNPHNGRDCIWVSELQAACVIGMAWEESRALLHAVYDHLYQPAHVLEHSWRNGDVVIWDNIALQHMRGSLKACGKRVLQRVIVGTDGVAPHVPA